ncbi:photosynthetic reaction center subunit H [Paracraurococcus ruber]|uniref:Photosynthetic reaction center subunit H n=1 Tax=Paracraurococcus ruber TaxID=77675 RepID=A0ABS1CTS3_9PROT|nr:photosynthetic reaction center subunit H [Paracraurococcus ruber]MBK1657881.1 photosynthetic reaction center subunit H [Paracraurococcus ruber]TDG32437.1 photosynthetic reaction center subunit H [Paracraurococcus ruber]
MTYVAYSTQFDLALLSLYLFYGFFIVLIMYLRNEDRREGFPLVHEVNGQLQVINPRSAPKPKVWNLAHGGPTVAGREERMLDGLLTPPARTPGSPALPLGNPLADGVGPAAYALRADVPDLTYDAALPKIVPLRVATEYSIAEEDFDPRGWYMVTADGRTVGTVRDVWVDRSDVLLRYIEVAVQGGDERAVVLPIGVANFDTRKKEAQTSALLADQFLAAPRLANPDQITLLEEDKVSAYFAGGYMYATPNRQEPAL